MSFLNEIDILINDEYSSVTFKDWYISTDDDGDKSGTVRFCTHNIGVIR